VIDADNDMADDGPASALDAAVAARDGLAARRIVSDLVAGAHGDAVVERLAMLAAAGSALAVELLVEVVDELGVARRAVRRFLLDEAAVDDVTQDTLITAAAAIASFRGEAKFTTWLYQVARNRAVDYVRRQRATVPLGDHEQSAAMRMSSLIASREAVRQLLERLPHGYQEAVRLRDVERLPYAEVAGRLGRNVNTVKSQVARGRALLAAMLDDERLA
jgi:RNA polymerase sigma-70 factor, ECF subfamily